MLLACALATLLFVSTLLGLRADALSFCLTYDEADYMYAASKGWAENWLDASVIPLGDFLARGHAALWARRSCCS